MSVNGIWHVEVLGAYGWESISTAFLENGDYKSASENHYSTGHYEVTGNHVKVTARHVAHGEARTLFGAKNKEVDLYFEGDLDGDQISGQASDGKSKLMTTFRATRLANL